jgi:nucleotide-binding universal stress UspA family protein
MNRIRTIVCAIDFSKDSRRALQAALEIAKRQPAHVVAIHVIELAVAQASVAGRDEARLRVESAAALRSFVEAEWKEAAVYASFTTEVRIGVPEREILACARECGADLIAAGTRGISGAAKLFFGSVAEKLLRRADVAVLTVPSPEEAAGGLVFSRVLAALDIDDTCEGTAAQAAAVARQLRLPLGVVHAVAPLPMGWIWAGTLDASTPLRVRRARTRLAAVVKALDAAADVDVRVGFPPEQIAAAATEHPGTLLVVGLVGTTPLQRLGSTAYRIVCASATPVLAVPIELQVALDAAPLVLAEAT